ncbi:GDP-mannose 4,6-dehydratase [Rathayibacter soli]|uniref:GDP-mannose 4,6-dehydratase n=1 Tax=Rathayibacter soli TaxID=3144168 RepID=UPI0027E423B1|nr:GDP-mannose 4,6-dehydratase [Glaciibacter superstes]
MTTESGQDVVLVTGAAGQDGGYLVDRLLSEGHLVHAMCHSTQGAERVSDRTPAARTHVVDLADAAAVGVLIAAVQPTQIFNLAGNSSVARSWDYPAQAADVIGVGPVRILDAAWRLQTTRGHAVRFVQASSAEVFGDTEVSPQDETTPRVPVTPYGAAKAFAQDLVGMYRSRGMHASSAILYNHESPTRPHSFVARKITHEVARIALRQSDRLVLGNIDVERDWGYAPDYVDALLRIARANSANDYIVATGEAHTVRDFVDAAFRSVGIVEWDDYVVIDPALYRPADPKRLVGDATRLRGLGWRPTIGFDQLVRLMVESDLTQLRAELDA